MSDDNHTDSSNYGYTPSPAWCITFVTLFTVTAAVHTGQAIRSKYWVIFPTLVLGALIECLGWAGRYWSSQNVLLLTPFLMQICTLILAPVFFSAYCYVLLGSAIKRLGPVYSLLRPGWYFAVFLIADLISLILQAVGGGQAASSAADSAPTKTATDIMVAGIIIQLVSMTVFVALGIDFIIRATSHRPYAFRERQIASDVERKALKRKSSEGAVVGLDSAMKSEAATEHVVVRDNLTRWWILLGGAMISSIMIVIRGVFRSVELNQGWSGYLIQRENYQNLLDGLPMVIAVAIFNFIHPMFLLPKKTSWRGYH